LDKEYGSNKTPDVNDERIAENIKSYFDQKVKTAHSNIKSELHNNSADPIRSDWENDIKNSPCLRNFLEITMEKLESIIGALPNKSSTLDPIPMWLIRNCRPELLPSVQFIVNELLRTVKIFFIIERNFH
jgi:hypothetical protein